MKRFLVALFGLLFGALLFAGPASAHATLILSTPSDGARLKTAPKTVSLAFDESVGLGSVGYVHVTNQDGSRVDARAAYHPGGDGQRVADDLRDSLGDGTYTVSYRVVSADSHPIAGSFRFVVGNGPLLAASAPGGSTVDRATGLLFDLARWVTYGGLALLGGAWLLLTVWAAGRDDLRARRLVVAGWVASVVGAAAELLLQGPYTAGAGPSRVFSWSLLDGTLHEHYGTMLSIRLLLLGALAVVLGRALQPAEPSRFEGVVWPIAAGLAITFSDTGHADTTSPRSLSVLLDGMHVLAMATWLGGLVMLLFAVLPRREPDELAEVLPAFSRVAFVAVVTLAGTGTYAAARGVGSWDAVFGTDYGWLVDAKVLLFVGLLAVANLSRRLVGRLHVERLRRAVVVEAFIGVSVLAFTAVLVAQPRGAEALAAKYREPVTASASLGDGRSVEVTVDPGTHGLVNVTVELSDPARSVTASAIEKAKQIGPVPLKLTASGRTLYAANGVNLPVAGSWEFDLVVTESEFDAISADVTITLH